MNNIVLVESAADIEAASFLSEKTFIALGPEALHYCKKNFTSYLTIDDFYNEDEAIKNLSSFNENFKKFISKLDEAFLKNYPEFLKWDIRPFEFYQTNLRQLFHGLLTRASILSKIISRYKNSTLYAPAFNSSPWAADLCFSSSENLWSFLLSTCFKLENVSFFKSPLENLPLKKESFKNKIKSKINSTFYLNLLARNWGGLDFKALGSNKAFLLDATDWTHLKEDFKKENLFLVKSSDKLFLSQNYFNLKNKNFSEIESFRNDALFQSSSVSIFQALAPRLQWIWEVSPLYFKKLTQKLPRLIQRHHFKKVLRASTPTGLGHFFNQVCQKSGCEVVGAQHGSIYPADSFICEYFDEIDLTTASQYMAYTQEVVKNYKDISPYQPKFFVQPSPRLKKTYEELSRKRYDFNPVRIVTYATTRYQQHTWAMKTNSFQTDCHSYENQVRIIEGCAEFQKTTKHDFNFIFKPHPGENWLTPPFVNDKIWNDRFKWFSNECNFLDCLWESDAIIIDSPTTTFIESCLTKLPLFVLISSYKPRADVINLIKKRAVVCESPQELLQAFFNWIETGAYPADVNNDEFLRKYGM